MSRSVLFINRTIKKTKASKAKSAIEDLLRDDGGNDIMNNIPGYLSKGITIVAIYLSLLSLYPENRTLFSLTEFHTHVGPLFERVLDNQNLVQY